jgi:hypothetical protein
MRLMRQTVDWVISHHHNAASRLRYPRGDRQRRCSNRHFLIEGSGGGDKN